MRFSVFLPPAAIEGEVVPSLLYLAGLTCNEETFATKAGAQRRAAELGLALIAPDTSPRGAGVPGETDSWDFGVGAGFYLDATQDPWARYWRMESYLLCELLPLIAGSATSRANGADTGTGIGAGLLPIDHRRLGICGHSMGGHGALTLALRHPGVFRSVSALAPICAPMQCAWGEKAFTGYLGPDRGAWLEHDATVLMQQQPLAPYPAGMLIDQGLQDKFLADGQLLPDSFAHACGAIGQPLTLRKQAGYDHGYYFVQSLINDHLEHHAAALRSPGTGSS